MFTSLGARVTVLPTDVQDCVGRASMARLCNQPGLGSTPKSYHLSSSLRQLTSASLGFLVCEMGITRASVRKIWGYSPHKCSVGRLPHSDLSASSPGGS